MFSLVCLFVVLVVSHLGFEGGTLVLIAPGPGHCFPFLGSFFIQLTYNLRSEGFLIHSIDR